MADTITALDTATTDDLIAALVARHRATLGQACGQLEDLDTILQAAAGITKALEGRLLAPLRSEMGQFVAEHPVCKAISGDAFASALLRMLQIPEPPRPRKPPQFDFPPFR